MKIFLEGTLRQILEELAGKPGDQSLRSVVADYLDDHEDARAEAVRWMVRENKRPYRHDKDAGFSWFDASLLKHDFGDHESNLPHEVFTELPPGKHKVVRTFEDANHGGDRTEAYLAAEVALWDAFVVAVGKGWKP